MKVINKQKTKLGATLLKKINCSEPGTILFVLTSVLVMCFVVAQSARAMEMAEDILDATVRVRPDFAIVVDGATISPDVPPVERGGIVFIPLRFAAESLRAKVTWYKDDKVAELVFPGKRTIKMKVDDPNIDMGGSVRMLPVAPFIFENRMMIPLRSTAECGYFRVQERPNAAILTTDKKKIEGFTNPGVKVIDKGGEREKDPLAEIRKKAHNDPITQSLAPYVKTAWGLAWALWVVYLVLGIVKGKPDGWKDMIFIALVLSVGVWFILYGGILLSTYWAAIVAVGTCIVGLVSTEPYEEKLVTMASAAQGFGLICTLFGLGLLIGPAIASRDIAAIGYGIYVKIEPTITGLSLSIMLSMLASYESRRVSNRERATG